MKLRIAFFLSIVLLFSASFRNETRTETAKPKIIYVYDALCGWCFGFSPVIEKFEQEHGSQFDFEVVSGGLRTGEQVGSINATAPFIKTAYKDIEEATGIQFGEKFVNGNLKSGEMVLNSLPPAIAMCIFREKFPQKALQFSRLLHQGIYVDNLEPEGDWYAACAAKLGFDAAEFKEKTKEDKYRQMAEQDFQRAKALGVTGFPAVLLLKDGKYTTISNGYTDYRDLSSKLLKAAKQ